MSDDKRVKDAWKKYDACVKKFTYMTKPVAKAMCKPKQKAAQKLGPRKK